MENSGNQSQSRFLIAAVLSMVVLFGWSYFFAPKPPAGDANTNANVASNANIAAATPTPAPVAQTPAVTPAATTLDTTPNRKITIKSPLYEVTLDSKGALATSWIILKNDSPKSQFPVYADGSNEADKKPMQLISPEALARSPQEVPFRLSTDDAAVNDIVNGRNYAISTAEETVTLAVGQEKQIEFTLTDASGVEVKKNFVFRGDSYIADLGISLKKGGESVPNPKLLIGASIGDHAINNHNFYHIESEAVASINGDIKRHQGNYTFVYDANGQSSLTDSGTVDWAGVGDAYFAMAAIPATQVQGLEYRAAKYDVQTKPFYDSIFQWVLRNAKTSETRHLVTVYMPITADGSVTKIFTGTKDYFLLSSLNQPLSDQVGRPVEITNLINFSNYWWLRWLTKPLSIPILYALNFFNGLTHNYGIAIIVFTFLFYSLLFPLRWSQSKSFKKASGNAPKMKDIQDRIKDMQKKGVPTDDPRMRALQMEQLKLTKDALPIGGCLPMLLQFPLLIAFYTAVTVSLEVRQATFLWLPDLSAADPWHLLEFAFAISMVLSMKFTPTAATVTSEQQMQQKMMTYLMPVMMLWVMWSAPSGLLLYWFFGNIVSFGQQMVINRLNKPAVPPGTQMVDSVPVNAKKVKSK
ncbi:MAG TPA: membrane protein insertase YidC [Pyrinomonadaceae bacterium]|nr:membrane protein insertase YidC [Chloracidobacterium sp.]MBP9934983.1 membrane protein insertase YidC [Pyrinomonadaceae bacterium]MBK7801391.1 membrane protein insertase YidC [Chloracidobacterium sp.]MBK9436710.1 membrane protein insertase YidC [Chloracidobacterium sp.]MBL0241700.1 membrane protein insertase YidC [Chloracidobacterium sp.]